MGCAGRRIAAHVRRPRGQGLKTFTLGNLLQIAAGALRILIEAFIVEATLDFDKKLGARFGANYAKRRSEKDGRAAGTNELTVGGTIGGAGDVALGTATGSIFNKVAGLK